MGIPLQIWFIILVALAFDFSNGFHDAANSIATMVSTRVLSPRAAVIWAAVFNFVAFLVLGVHVAKTIGKGVVDPSVVTPLLILAGLIGAIIWNLTTWWYGLPSSSSHALIGGFVGAGIAAAGPKAIIVKGIVKIAWFIVLSPLIGMALGFILMFLVTFLFRRATPHRVHGLFRWLQFVSSSAFSLGHGGNDAQKTIGMIAALLYSTGYLHGEFHVPLWVVIAAQTAIGLGTMVGGWRIVHTMGMKVTKLRVEGGFCAQAAGAITLIGATLSGIPVSTTHTITGAIMGVGSTRRLSAVRWGVAGGIVWAWLLTIPASAVMSAISFLVLRIFWRT
ncbi:MAG: inorganic phosphate transporter [Candidatus Eisenbacteria bacterium]|uniref:Inorganic phosphate transporter n=1 Tax=Eiseniibacteriota bacterium TaxID=2212470 RepID=A0A538TAQ1_UNCEI|nr:MAG: inorganic phosphate transporter [Candidatus Eisenbacteria bacterium]